MNFNIIPGLKEEKEKLSNMIASKRIPHALMFLGKKGSPTLPMALSFAQALLCEQPKDHQPCQNCTSCRLSEKNQHPDIHFIFPIIKPLGAQSFDSNFFLPQWREFLKECPYGDEQEWRSFLVEDKTPIIPVESSREIIRQLGITSFGGKYKILICWKTDKMNIGAANALLKLIEEPPPKTILIFCTESPEKLPDTILSRTQKFNIPLFSESEIFSILQQYNATLTLEQTRPLISLVEFEVQRAINYAQNIDFEKELRQLFWNFIRMCFRKEFDKIITLANDFHNCKKQDQQFFFTFSLQTFSKIAKILAGQTLIFFDPQQEKSVLGLSKYLDINKLRLISYSFESARFHIERNASVKLQIMILSFQVTRVLQQKH